MKRYHYLAGLPRSGSTLLTGILNQNPRFYSNIQDPLCEMIRPCVDTLRTQAYKTVVSQEIMRNTLLGAIEGFYRHLDQEVVFNMNRMWPQIPEYLVQLDPNFKMICCMRDYVSVLNSLEHLYKRRSLLSPSTDHPMYGTNTYSVWHRTNWLAQESFVRAAYNGIQEMYYGQYRSHMLLVEYDALVNHPEQTMRKVYDFIEEPYYTHDFDCVEHTDEEYDSAVGLPGLHTIKRKVAPTTTPMILPPDLVQAYSNWEFWR